MTKKQQWEELVAKESKGLTSDEMTWFTPEGIGLKILYTEDDIKDLDVRKSMPGMAPFMRGPKATMYAGRPWTIRQYAGFSTAEESNTFYRKALAAGGKEYLLRLIWQHTVVTTQIIHASQAMLVKPESPSTRLRI